MLVAYSNTTMVDMQQKKRSPTIAIKEHIHKLVKVKADAKGVSIVDFVNDLILLNIEKDDFLRKYYGEYLSMVGYHQNSIFVKDTKKGRTAEIFLKDSKLYCTLDDTDDCIHIHYALAQPEIAKLNMKKPSK